MRRNAIKRPDGTLRIGAGAGFAGDRIDPAVELIEHGELDVLAFETLAERTIALAQLRRRSKSGAGFDERLTQRIGAVLASALNQRVLLITNGGAADPRGGGLAVRQVARDLGCASCRIAVVTGDDVLDRLDLDASAALDTGEPLAAYRGRIVSANAYLGAAPLVAALDSDPNIVVAGRTTDIALFLAPMIHAFGWSSDDWRTLAGGSVVGHLLECAGQLTGGYFADGDRKRVPRLARLGFPYADVNRDGTARFAKVAGSGGRLDRSTCLEQLLYEVTDPSAYLTPDVTIDFRAVEIVEPATDSVVISGANGHPPPATLKASIGIDGGFSGVGAISYAGLGCLGRARLAGEILRERWAEIYRRDPDQLHMSLIGMNSATPWKGLGTSEDAEPPEVRLRVAVQSMRHGEAQDLAREVEGLYTNGPAAGGGVETSVRETVAIISTLIPRQLVEPRIEVLE
jgi:hypothetical protein